MNHESAADRLVRTLAEKSVPEEKIPSLPEARAVDSFSDAVRRKAWWCLQTTMETMDQESTSWESFSAGYTKAWCTFYNEAARVLSRREIALNVPASMPQIILLYHFPVYPRIGFFLAKNKTLALVKRRAVWMNADDILHIDDRSVMRRILGHLRAGGRVAAMIDHAFPGTHNDTLRFLGRACLTPTGLIHLAWRSGFSIGLGHMRAESFEINEPTATESSLALAQNIMDDLSDLILGNPPEWLLWPNLNHRWCHPTSDRITGQ